MNKPLGNPLSLADMHERLGHLIADGSGRIEGMDGHTWNANQTHLRGLQIDDYIRVPQVPEDTSDLRALQAIWDEDERLLGEARERYQQHRDSARYIQECNEIIERDDLDRLGREGNG